MVPEISTATVTFFVILGHFLPFYARNSQKNENFIKMKKVPTDTIILKKCTKNHDHSLYWHMIDVIIISHVGLFFALSPP